jgi:hypothetical protein
MSSQGLISPTRESAVPARGGGHSCSMALQYWFWFRVRAPTGFRETYAYSSSSEQNSLASRNFHLLPSFNSVPVALMRRLFLWASTAV